MGKFLRAAATPDEVNCWGGCQRNSVTPANVDSSHEWPADTGNALHLLSHGICSEFSTLFPALPILSVRSSLLFVLCYHAAPRWGGKWPGVRRGVHQPPCELPLSRLIGEAPHMGPLDGSVRADQNKRGCAQDTVGSGGCKAPVFHQIQKDG